MKKIPILFVLGTIFFAVLCGSATGADKPAIIPFYGYQFGGSLNTYDGKLRIEDGENYGATIEFPIDDEVAAHFVYIHLDSSLIQTVNSTGLTEKLSDIKVDYYHLGGTSLLQGDINVGLIIRL